MRKSGRMFCRHLPWARSRTTTFAALRDRVPLPVDAGEGVSAKSFRSRFDPVHPFQENSMYRRMIAVCFALATAGATALARAEDVSLLGTWRLKSFVREVTGTGERYDQLGGHPDGYISYSADGRMMVFFVAGEQPRPRNEPSDEERIQLHKSMLAYGGTYSVSPGTVVHHIDIEWDGRRLGTDQVRFFTINGDTLSIKTEPNRSPIDGCEGVGILTFERVKRSHQ